MYMGAHIEFFGGLKLQVGGLRLQVSGSERRLRVRSPKPSDPNASAFPSHNPPSLRRERSKFFSGFWNRFGLVNVPGILDPRQTSLFGSLVSQDVDMLGLPLGSFAQGKARN